MHCSCSSKYATTDLNHSGAFKIDSIFKNWEQTWKMKENKVTLVNTAINTDPLVLDDDEESWKSATLPKTREGVKHIQITSSDIIRENYEFGEILGKGGFGTVLELTDKRSNQTWAIKVVVKKQMMKESRKMNALRREIQILKMVQHPHIILLYRIFESAKKMYLILEKCNGELGKLFKQKGMFSEEETKEVIRQLTSAVAYLHKNEIVHRDLKLENILLAQNPANPEDQLYIKVTDFGLGIIKGNCHEMLHERCGTLSYISPEVIQKGSYSHLCDVWSIGVIMFLLLNGKFPFNANNDRALINMICNTEPNYSTIKISNEGTHLLTQMLNKDPANRISAAEISLHPWLTGATLSDNKLENIFEMMKKWRPDMLMPRGSICDWTVPNGTTEQDFQNDMAPRFSKSGRKALKIPVKNIEFDRKKSTELDRKKKLEFDQTKISKAIKNNQEKKKKSGHRASVARSDATSECTSYHPDKVEDS